MGSGLGSACTRRRRTWIEWEGGFSFVGGYERSSARAKHCIVYRFTSLQNRHETKHVPFFRLALLYHLTHSQHLFLTVVLLHGLGASQGGLDPRLGRRQKSPPL